MYEIERTMCFCKYIFFNFTTPLKLELDDKSNSTAARAQDDVHVHYTNYIARRTALKLKCNRIFFSMLNQMKT